MNLMQTFVTEPHVGYNPPITPVDLADGHFTGMAETGGNTTIMADDDKKRENGKSEDRKSVFKQGLKEHMDALYGMALRLTRDPHDAEDLVAEAATKAWAALDSLEDTSRFRAWIFRILHNTFVSDYRKRVAAPATESYDESESDEEPFSLFEKLHQPFLLWWGNPEQEYINKLLRQDISKAIDDLPETFRLAVMFVDVEGLSYEECAEIQDIPVGTVRSRLKRGRALLQKRLWKQASDAGLGTTGKTEATNP